MFWNWDLKPKGGKEDLNTFLKRAIKDVWEPVLVNQKGVFIECGERQLTFIARLRAFKWTIALNYHKYPKM